MKHLLSIRTNILYSKIKDEKEKEIFKRYQELIFLVDKPEYLRTNEGEIIRARGVEEMRFIVSDEALQGMIDLLKRIQESEPGDLE